MNLKNVSHKSESGFTLIELLVAMSIVMILSAVTVVSIRTGSSEQALLRSAQTLAFNIRKAQNLALSPKKYSATPVCFYGLKLKTTAPYTSYFIYYHEAVNCVGAVKNFASDSVIETIQLERGVEFSNVDINKKDAAFVPPEPKVYFNNNDNFIEETIILRLSGGTATRTVKINKFGRVEIQ